MVPISNFFVFFGLPGGIWSILKKSFDEKLDIWPKIQHFSTIPTFLKLQNFPSGAFGAGFLSFLDPDRGTFITDITDITEYYGIRGYDLLRNITVRNISPPLPWLTT